MGCENSPFLNDTELLACMDGAAPKTVAAHAATCPACQARMKKLSQLQVQLTRTFGRLSCPTSGELREYFFELLNPERAGSVQQHVDRCPHCTRDLFEDYIDVPPLPSLATPPKTVGFMDNLQQQLGQQGATLGLQVRWLVAELLNPQAPAYALRRATAYPLAGHQSHLFQIDDNIISLIVQPDAEDPDFMAIEGQALTDPPLTSPPDSDSDQALPTQPQIHLWRASTLAATCVLDEAGDFAIDRLTPGAYQLILSSAHFKIKIPDFQIGPAADTGI